MSASIGTLARVCGVVTALLAGMVACGGGGGGGVGGSAPDDPVGACRFSCDAIAGLRCPEPISPTVESRCQQDCDGIAASSKLAECGSLITSYYRCISRKGNIQCLSGGGFETVDDCDSQLDAANDCSAECPAGFPVDCGDGFCCSLGTQCLGGGRCG